jgi:hypothetical protein
MKRALLPILSALLIATMALAQDRASGNAGGSPQDHTQSSPAQGNRLRGCLSGSDGNFTLTDLNGMHYRLVGDDMALKSKVGHEVEVNGTQNRAGEDSNSGSGEDVARAGDTLQVTDVIDISGSCNLPHGSDTLPNKEDDAQPEAPTNAEPPRPQLLTLAQENRSSTP